MRREQAYTTPLISLGSVPQRRSHEAGNASDLECIVLVVTDESAITGLSRRRRLQLKFLDLFPQPTLNSFFEECLIAFERVDRRPASV